MILFIDRQHILIVAVNFTVSSVNTAIILVRKRILRVNVSFFRLYCIENLNQLDIYTISCSGLLIIQIHLSKNYHKNINYVSEYKKIAPPSKLSKSKF